MTIVATPILLIGESDVGKTHYGAQLLRRLNLKTCALRMDGAAENIEPFDEALTKISNGLSAGHTSEMVYTDSVWPVAAAEGAIGELVWPDYGGEQVKKLVDTKKLPIDWREQTMSSRGWVVMVRPTRTTLPNDALTRARAVPTVDGDDDNLHLTGQGRIIELLQILIHTYAPGGSGLFLPPIVLLLTCFDELDGEISPLDYLQNHLPLIDSFLRSNWPDKFLSIFGLSALGQALSPTGPENHGYIVEGSGEKNTDLTLPLLRLLQTVGG